jgi:Type II secretion system (T2SS), protein F
MRAGDVNIGDMNIAVMWLTAAAVLVWPGVCSASVRSDDDQVLRAAGRGCAGAAAGEDHVGAVANPDSGGIRTAVPVAEVAGVIDLLALTLRGGVGLVEAMEAVATRVGGPLGLHLRTVAAAGRWGVDEATAWASVPSAWQPVARALRMAATAGVPPADALVGAADEVRRSEQQRLEMATATLGVRIVLPLGLVFLPAFILTTVVPIVLALARQVLDSR